MYADDLVLITRNHDKLQLLLDAASVSVNLFCLEFRPEEGASLSMMYGKGYESNLQMNLFQVEGKEIPALSEHEHYRYIGIPIGMIRDDDNLESLADDLCNNLERINSTLLAPWQKLDAIKTFKQPCLTFAHMCQLTSKSIANEIPQEAN